MINTVRISTTLFSENKIKIILLIWMLMIVNLSIAQKKLLALDNYKSWPEISRAGISNDGKYAWYMIENQPIGKTTCIIHSTDNEKQIEFINVTDILFSNDSQLLFARFSKDSLLSIKLNNFVSKKISNVASYQLFMKGEKELLAYISSDSILNFADLSGQDVFKFANTIDYRINSKGTFAIIQQAVNLKGRQEETLQWFDLTTGKSVLIYKGANASKFIFDNSGTQLAFCVNENGKNSLWYYKMGNLDAVKLLDQNSLGNTDSVSIEHGQFWSFNWGEKKIYFGIKPLKKKSNVYNSNLTIWSYKDAFLQSARDNPNNSGYETTENLAELNISDRKVTQLIHNQERISGMFSPNRDRYLLFESVSGGMEEAEWNIHARKSYFLYDLREDKIFTLKKNSKYLLQCLHISPGQLYTVFYDPEFGQYFSYNIAKRKMIPIFKDSSAVLMGIDYQRTGGVCGWLSNDRAVIINDTYDLVGIDPNGKSDVIKWTGGEGRKNKIVFFPMDGRPENIIENNGQLVLYAFDIATKKVGLCNLKLHSDFKFSEINFNSVFIKGLNYIYNPIYFRNNSGSDPVMKAKNSDSYLIKLEKSNEAPNYFFTTDFKNYKSFSNNHPERDFNYLVAELHIYKDSLGNSYQGVLYKPENFDYSIKYPVVFNYYMISSNEVNHFVSPNSGNGDIDIAYLVSNGYLVFKTDIKPQVAKVGESAFVSVNAAADYLSQFKWVNPQKMAITGHSFGGWETNYILTHSNRFAAAITAAGVSNLISSYNSTWGYFGGAKSEFVRKGPYKMVSRLTDDLSGYIENSPILFANKITTPILIMHNTDDENVPFFEGKSFFIELRSLQKKAWMLSFTGDGHGISNNNFLDYYGRVKEYLDYFLMDKAIPDWMK